MVFYKINELYSEGKLVAEVFRKGYLIALTSSSNVCLKNWHYYFPDKKNFIMIRPDEFSDVSDAVTEWGDTKDLLWGRRAHGSSWAGHTSTTFYPPGDTEGINIKKGQSHSHLAVGQLERHVMKGALDFTFERFCLGMSRDDWRALLDEHHVPLLPQVFALYHARSRLYAPIADVDDLEGSLAVDVF